MNERSEFREDNFQKAMGFLADLSGEDPANPLSGKGRKGKSKKGPQKGMAYTDPELTYGSSLDRCLRYLQDCEDDYGEGL